MALLGNIIWFVVGGWLLFILYTLAAIMFLPVFIPIFRIAKYSLFPLGKGIVSQDQLNTYRDLKGTKSDSDNASQALDVAKSATQKVSGVLNILWMFTFGWILALVHLLAAIVNLCLIWLIITIPNIVGHWRMMKISFLPFNRVVVPKQLADDIETEIAKGKLGL